MQQHSRERQPVLLVLAEFLLPDVRGVEQRHQPFEAEALERRAVVLG